MLDFWLAPAFFGDKLCLNRLEFTSPDDLAHFAMNFSFVLRHVLRAGGRSGGELHDFPGRGDRGDE